MNVRELRGLLAEVPNQEMSAIAAIEACREQGFIADGVAANLSRAVDWKMARRAVLETRDDTILRLAVAFARAYEGLEALGVRVNDWVPEGGKISAVEIVEGDVRRRLQVKS